MTTDQFDYPAAHSMDTTWFAVDRNGCVAAFSSGEAGAVPAQLQQDENFVDLIRAGLGKGEAERPDFANLDDEGDELNPLDNLARLRELASGSWSLKDLNMFQYMHENKYENWIAGPYSRKAAPSDPLKIDALPVELRKEIAEFKNISFAETPFFQPAEHVKCESWESWYVTTKGKIKALPGTSITKRIFGWITPSLMLSFINWAQTAAEKKRRQSEQGSEN
jgi:hypothetical protein